jgi:serine protease Do
MKKPADYGGQLQQYWPGDTISFQLKRADSSYTKNVVLAPRPPMAVNHPAELFAGGKSSRRDGFDKVFAHDARLKPWQCGGPVYDSSGHFYGINIARYSRTATLAIPAIVVKQVITEALQRKYLSYLNE